MKISTLIISLITVCFVAFSITKIYNPTLAGEERNVTKFLSNKKYIKTGKIKILDSPLIVKNEHDCKKFNISNAISVLAPNKIVCGCIVVDLNTEIYFGVDKDNKIEYFCRPHNLITVK